VNFLSHGLLVRRTGSDAVLIGSALPDLAPLADRQLRMTPRRIDLLDEIGDPDVARGCRHHRLVDRTFHHGRPFNEAQKQIEAVLPEGSLPLPRGLLAHVLVEIGIDAEVLRAYPEFANHTYPDGFDGYDWPSLFGRMREVCCAPTDALEGLVGRFDSGAFLRTYATDDGVLDRFHGMVVRLGRGGMTPETRDSLLPAVALAREHSREAFDDLMPWELELQE
jgi:hypothetical protein